MRLRIRALRRVRPDGHGSIVSTVFCPVRCRSIGVDTCRLCPRLSNEAHDAIECTAPRPERLSRDLMPNVPLGGDACVGEAVGDVSVSVHADLTVKALTHSLEEQGARVAVVVDDEGRLVGLVDAASVGKPAEPVLVHEVARRIRPLHESSPLAHAVERLVHERARALPVVDDDGHVVALLTDLDALRWVAGRGPG